MTFVYVVGPGEKKTKLGFVLRIALGVSMFWNVEGVRGLFIYTADEYSHTHVDSGIFFFNFQCNL